MRGKIRGTASVAAVLLSAVMAWQPLVGLAGEEGTISEIEPTAHFQVMELSSVSGEVLGDVPAAKENQQEDDVIVELASEESQAEQETEDIVISGNESSAELALECEPDISDAAEESVIEPEATDEPESIDGADLTEEIDSVEWQPDMQGEPLLPVAIAPQEVYVEVNSTVYSTNINDYCKSVAEAASLVKAQLTARNTSFTLKIRSTEGDADTLMSQIMEQATAHTRHPTEGDYIAYQVKVDNFIPEVTSDGAYYYYTFNATIGYYSTAEQEAITNEKLENVMDGLGLDGKNSYEKICAIYDYICENVVYDTESLSTADNEKFTAYSALVKNSAVCQGYSNLLYRMALTAGIDCRIVSGTTASGATHSWNIVKLDDEYYFVDATWDSALKQRGEEYQYFLKGKKNFPGHVSDAHYYIADDDYIVKDHEEESEQDAEEVSKISLEESRLSFTDYNPKQIVITQEIEGDLKWSSSDEKIAVIDGEGLVTPVKRGSCTITVSTLDEKAVGTCRIEVTLSDIEVDNGQCGDDAFWSLRGDGLLTITGTGDMWDYTATTEGIWEEIDTVTERPWENYLTDIESLYISGDITSLGDFSFYRCSNLDYIVIPDSVTDLGNGTFGRCRLSGRVSLPTGLSRIGYKTFEYPGSSIRYSRTYIPSTVTYMI